MIALAKSPEETAPERGASLRIQRPLVPLSACMVLLDKSEDDLLALIESGALAFAFDIAAPNSARREIRVYRGSLLSFLAGKRDGVDSAPELPAIISAVIGIEIGPSVIRLTQCARRLSCSATHVTGLVAAGELIAARAARRGPDGSTLLQRASLAQFLHRRRLA